VSDTCNVLTPEWKDFMINFSDRLLFATDAHMTNRWAKHANVVQRWRVILGQLPPEVAARIAIGTQASSMGSSVKLHCTFARHAGAESRSTRDDRLAQEVKSCL
jgi:hypothetical protein